MSKAKPKGRPKRKERDDMIDAMVMHCDHENDRTEGFGRRTFRQLPRIGECIEFTKADVAHLYRVVAVHHPNAPASTAADIFVVHVGETAPVVESYRQSGAKQEGR